MSHTEWKVAIWSRKLHLQQGKECECVSRRAAKENDTGVLVALLGHVNLSVNLMTVNNSGTNARKCIGVSYSILISRFRQIKVSSSRTACSLCTYRYDTIGYKSVDDYSKGPPLPQRGRLCAAKADDTTQ